MSRIWRTGYWEKKGLLNLTFDKEEDLVSICLCRPESAEVSRTSAERRVLAFPPSGELRQAEAAPQFLPTLRRQAAGETAPAALCAHGDIRESSAGTPSRSAQDSVSSAGPVSAPADAPGRDETVSELEALENFRADPDRTQLLFVVEQYIGKPLSLNEIRIIWHISQKLGFSDDLLDYLIQYCVDRGKKDFRYIRKVAENWASLGIMTPAQAESAPEQVSEDKGRKAAGRKSSGRSSSSRTASADEGGRSARSSSAAAGAGTDADISAGSGRKTRRTRGGNAFNQFEQNSYDFDALEEELLQS